MVDRFDENARTVLARAREEARALGRECVDTEHILLGVFHHDAGGNDPVLSPAGITTENVRAWLAQHDGRGGGAADRSLPFTPNGSLCAVQVAARVRAACAMSGTVSRDRRPRGRCETWPVRKSVAG